MEMISQGEKNVHEEAEVNNLCFFFIFQGILPLPQAVMCKYHVSWGGRHGDSGNRVGFLLHMSSAFWSTMVQQKASTLEAELALLTSYMMLNRLLKALSISVSSSDKWGWQEYFIGSQ